MKHLRYLDLYHRGEVTAEQIHDFVTAWHDGTAQQPDRHVALHVSLGLTWAEYGMWATLGILPSETEHATQAHRDVAFVGPPEDRQPMHVHGPLRCRPACPIHWPSNHMMAAWPLSWRQDAGVMMRLCRHGLDHPDPDDQQVRLHPDLAEHDCDGCCRPTIDGDLVRPAPAALQPGDKPLFKGITGRSA